MSATAAQRVRWKASGALLRVLREPAYEALQARWIARSIRTGRWRDAEVELLPSLVRDGDTALDVGANFGLYSYHLARLVGDAGRVIAIEAVPSTCRSLRRTLDLLNVDHRVELHELGASDRTGVSTFVLPRRADGSVDAGVAWSRPPGQDDSDHTDGDVRVRMAPLDDIVGDADVDFIKIDTEGAELFVLRGATELIARSAPTLLLEVSPSTFARQGVGREEVEALLEASGYQTYRLEPATGRLVAAPAASLNGNMLAVHPSRMDTIAALQD
jgi:FkbM family methyltransferase